MRNTTTTISSSIASALAPVAVASVASVGGAVRTFLHLTSMREPLGYWLKRCQSEIARGWHPSGVQSISHLQFGDKPGLLPRFGRPALDLCPAPTRLDINREPRQG